MTTGYTRTVQDSPTVSVVGDVYAMLARAEDTGGALTVLHAFVPPGGGPPPHVHLRDDESFFVIEGSIDLALGRETKRVGPGSFAFVPRGLRHAFKNNSGAPARMLIWTAPGGLDRLFTEVGVALPRGSTTPAPVTDEAIARLVRACPDHGIEIEPPPAD